MQVHHRNIRSMGTRLDLVIAGSTEDTCDTVIREVRSELERIEALLSIHRSDSMISLLNHIAHSGIIELDAEMIQIFSEIKALHRETKGYFDITMKPVSDFYRNHEGQLLPVKGGVRERIGMDQVILERGGIRFRTPGMVLDLGGYGKGYAVKRLLPILESYRIGHALVSFGESLVYGWGRHPYGDAWKIRLPGGEENDPVQFDLVDEAISTSGNSLNNQKKFANSGHIVNPVTLQMVTRSGLISVKSKDPVRAEVYSTALFSAGPEHSAEILQDSRDLEARWISPEK
jgi:thiamine biosynthesis lipoprotein